MRNHVRYRIEEYLMGLLDADAQRNFEQHIGSCRSCRKALQDSRDADSYLKWLLPLEAIPLPGPEFYSRVEKSIEKKLDSGWFSNLAAVLYGPRLVYPLLFLFLGLLLAAWAQTVSTEWGEAGVLGIPPARFSGTISSEADRANSRDLVMVSLMEGQ